MLLWGIFVHQSEANDLILLISPANKGYQIQLKLVSVLFFQQACLVICIWFFRLCYELNCYQDVTVRFDSSVSCMGEES